MESPPHGGIFDKFESTHKGQPKGCFFSFVLTHEDFLFPLVLPLGFTSPLMQRA
jgi:hypothetical protein